MRNFGGDFYILGTKKKNRAYTVISMLLGGVGMELTFSELRSKEVVNTQDGRKLGKACDIVLCYPENRWLGIIVPGNGGMFRKRSDLFIDLKNIVKIGEDVILVNVGARREEKRGKGNPCAGNYGGCNLPSGRERNYEEWE